MNAILLSRQKKGQKNKQTKLPAFSGGIKSDENTHTVQICLLAN